MKSPGELIVNLNNPLLVKRPSLRVLFYSVIVALVALLTGIAVVVFNTGPLALLFPIGILLVIKQEWGFYFFIASIPIEAAISSDIFSLPKLLGLAALTGFVLSAVLRRRKIYWDFSLTLMVLFEIWGLLSYLWSRNPSQTLSTWISYGLLAILYFLIINQVRSFRALDRLLVAFFVGAVIMAGSGGYDLYTGSYLATANGRLEGVTGNANAYAIEALVGILGVYWVWMTRRSKLIKAFLILLIGLLGITFVTTLSHGGIISLAVFGLMLVLLLKDRLRWAVMLAIGALLIGLFAPGSLWQRFMDISSETRIVDLWPTGLNLFQRNPILGYGLGASSYVIGQALPYVGSNSLLSVHSAPLAVALDLGVPGLLFYLAFIAVPTFNLASVYLNMHNIKRNSLLGGFAVVLISVLVAYLFSWVKGGGLETGKLLWLLIGLESGVALLIRSERGEN